MKIKQQVNKFITIVEEVVETKAQKVPKPIDQMKPWEITAEIRSLLPGVSVVAGVLTVSKKKKRSPFKIRKAA